MRAEIGVALCALAVVLVALLGLAPVVESRAAATDAASLSEARVDLLERLGDVRFERDGERLLVRTEVGGEERLIDAEAWARALDGAQRAQGAPSHLERLFHVRDRWSLLWVGVGFLGQALFTLRILLQWVTSERAKRSVVPVGFWWSSLAGGILLLAYFLWRHDIVGIVGQSTGAFVYARNLFLIHRGARERKTADGFDAAAAVPTRGG